VGELPNKKREWGRNKKELSLQHQQSSVITQVGQMNATFGRLYSSCIYFLSLSSSTLTYHSSSLFSRIKLLSSPSNTLVYFFGGSPVELLYNRFK
jgi:hypothetical protein